LKHLVSRLAFDVFSAGAETSTSVLGTILLAMVQNPEVQKKAQQELDLVLNGRLPDHDDFGSLPYVTAVVVEGYRWVCSGFARSPADSYI
jgi:cytochrome P450